MTKIVEAANAMILNKKKISAIATNTKELYFIYDDKYKWSISKKDDNSGDIFLYFYPGEQSLTELATMEAYEWSEFTQFIRYSSGEIGTREAEDTFSELYMIVKERVFSVDEVLEDIINSAPF